MSDQPTATVNSEAPRPTDSLPGLSRGTLFGLGLLLVVAVGVAGAPDLDTPWMQGDEFIFIVNNADVNAGPVAFRANTLGQRCAAIITKIHDDLYQPIPILTYALEWELSRGNPLSFRRTDILLHALNGLLLWAALTMILRGRTPSRDTRPAILGWALALLWALHPVLITTYAGDMGRTHLLSATFALLALQFHVRALRPGKGLLFLPALAALLLAMLCKPIPGWALLVFVLEAHSRGWRAALRSPRWLIVTAVCAAFAALTLWTSSQAGLTEDAAEGLFGDPLSRSALAVWIYTRNLVAPFWLSFWYPPDPHTGWSNPLVWLGLFLALATAFHALRAWQRPESRPIALGWAWCWAFLLPVIGLIGAREAAATDRYLYQPLMGIMLVIGVVLTRLLARRETGATHRAYRSIIPVAAIVGLAMLLWDLPLCRIARSDIRRGTRLVRLNPDDPRALQALAAAYDFARNHRLTADDLSRVPPGTSQLIYFNDLFRETLTRAASVEDLQTYFPGPEDRGPFHRQLSYRFLTARSPEQSLAQAQLAMEHQPENFLTWTRLAHAYQALGRYEEAADAYARCEPLLPDITRTRRVHFTDFGYLLLFELGRDAEGCEKLNTVFQLGDPPPPAKLGMALCQIRYGEGAAGFRLVREILQADPGNIRAGLILAEFHLRSHHWEPAYRLYDAILRDDPTQYVALRGFHEVCLQIDRCGEAALAWQDAADNAPDRREFRSFAVWALALAGENEAATAAATELLEDDPNNPLARLALLLTNLRGGDVDNAVEQARRARVGEPIPEARAFVRAASSIRVLLDRSHLPPEAAIARAAVIASGDFAAGVRREAAQQLDEYVAQNPDSAWADLARELRGDLSDDEPSH